MLEQTLGELRQREMVLNREREDCRRVLHACRSKRNARFRA